MLSCHQLPVSTLALANFEPMSYPKATLFSSSHLSNWVFKGGGLYKQAQMHMCGWCCSMGCTLPSCRICMTLQSPASLQRGRLLPFSVSHPDSSTSLKEAEQAPQEVKARQTRSQKLHLQRTPANLHMHPQLGVLTPEPLQSAPAGLRHSFITRDEFAGADLLGTPDGLKHFMNWKSVINRPLHAHSGAMMDDMPVITSAQ